MSSIRICEAGCGGAETVIWAGEVSTAGRSTTGCVFVVSPLGVWIAIAAAAARRGEGESERGGGWGGLRVGGSTEGETMIRTVSFLGGSFESVTGSLI